MKGYSTWVGDRSDLVAWEFEVDSVPFPSVSGYVERGPSTSFSRPYSKRKAHLGNPSQYEEDGTAHHD